MRMMMTKQFTIPDHDTDDDLNWDYDQDCEEQHDPFSDSDIDDWKTDFCDVESWSANMLRGDVNMKNWVWDLNI